MKKIVLTTFIAIGFLSAIFSQGVTGAAGVCYVNTDPNTISSMQNQDSRFDCQLAMRSGTLYKFSLGRPNGFRWKEVEHAGILEEASLPTFNENIHVLGLIAVVEDEGTYQSNGDEWVLISSPSSIWQTFNEGSFSYIQPIDTLSRLRLGVSTTSGAGSGLFYNNDASIFQIYSGSTVKPTYLDIYGRTWSGNPTNPTGAGIRFLTDQLSIDIHSITAYESGSVTTPLLDGGVSRENRMDIVGVEGLTLRGINNSSVIEIGVDSAEIVVKNDSVRINGIFQDADGDVATTGQVLSSDVDGRLDWIDQDISAKIFENYTELRDANIDSSTVVTVRDFTYIFRDSTYTTIGGVFYYNECSENGGTCIGGWSRIFDGVYKPEFWELGGYGINGSAYQDRLEGIGGIEFESDRVNAALSFGEEVKMQKRLYTIRDKITIPEIGVDWDGNGCTLKRGSNISSPLTANTTGLIVDVQDASDFFVGMTVIAYDISMPFGGKGEQENSISQTGLITRTIESISGNTITVSQSLGNMEVGDVLAQRFDLVGSNNATGIFTDVSIKNMTIDGNRSEWNNTLDWRLNHEFSPGDGIGNLMVTNVVFQEGSTTMVFPNKGLFLDCTFKKANGSAAHVGSSTTTGISFINCKFYNLIEESPIAATHTASAIEFSTGVCPVHIENCEFIDVNGCPFGPMQSNVFVLTDINYDIKGLTFKDNYVKRCRGNTTISTSTVDHELFNINISDNFFINSGDIYMQGSGISEGIGNYSTNIRNNFFINSARFYITNNSLLNIESNIWIQDEYHEDYIAWSSATTGQESLIQIVSCDRVNISNNYIGGVRSNNEFIRNGLLIQHNNTVRRNAVGDLTEFSYMQSVSVDNNIISNFTTGITSYQDAGYAQSPIMECVGWRYNNNTVYVNDNAGLVVRNQCGILVDAGVIAEHNKIYMRDVGDGYAMVVKGITDGDGGTRRSRLRGGKAKNNTIICESTSNAVLLGSTGSTASYNIDFRNNDIQGIVNNRSTNSHFAYNFKLSNQSFPEFTNPSIPFYRDWKEDKDIY